MEKWRDTSLPVDERVTDLLGRMTPAEKVAQMRGVWLTGGAVGEMAPQQHNLIDKNLDFNELITDGLGQLTRVFGTTPIAPGTGVKRLAGLQEQVMRANRFGIPALAHEECLTGFTTQGATIFPTPLAWGASFDPRLVERMATMIGRGMREAGIHQGLSPVLDVTRDPRWGRTEETIGEDPYLVATVATAYVKGLQSEGVIATLKHFAGYSASRGARNLGPVSMGRREFIDVLLPPFELALREGKAGSVMPSYSDVDGVPASADPWLLTDLLRGEWGFTGTVVSDYFAVEFLQSLHGVAADLDEAAQLALTAGIDVELPMTKAYLKFDDEALVDRACRRILRQKCELGLLDPDWTPPSGEPDLDPPEAREVARLLAEESVVLLANDGTLPLRPKETGGIAVVGPLADDTDAMFGCYTFPRHVGLHHPDFLMGVDVMTLLASLRERLPYTKIVHARGCDVRELGTDDVAEAVAAARRAEVCVAVVGDRAGLFDVGTSGEGCDATSLDLPGDQAHLLEAVLATGTPTIIVLMSGRPYALGRFASRAVAIVQAFFPGQEGGRALASVLTGEVCPSGRMPISVPREGGGQPWTYLVPKLGHASEVSNIDPTPLFPFGHGLSYTTFEWDVSLESCEARTDEGFSFSVDVRNTGEMPGADVVQVYLHDPVASVTRPPVRLVGYARVEVEPGRAKRVTFDFHADLASFTGLDNRKVVEPGLLELRVSRSSQDVRHVIRVDMVGARRIVGHDRRMTMGATVADV